MNEFDHRLAGLSPAKKKLLEQLANRSSQSGEPIAIVGMGCRFPGAPNLESYWSLIHNGIDATTEIPPSRWDVDEFFDPTGEVLGKMTNRWGAFLDDVDVFDPLFFGISPREAEKMDPQQRLLLETTWESLEQGGFSPHDLRGSSTGVFVGIGGLDYSRIPMQFDDYYERINVYSGTGNALSISANRLSYIFDFRGPSLAVDTACSSGLVATHLAIRALRNRECNAAVAGAVNLILTPETTIAFSMAKMLSPTGKCRPFDASANGYVRGEGCGVVILKRLADATRDGDNVLAVIRGSSVNQDGRTSGITAPNGLAQMSVIRDALSDAGLGTADVSYVEAHGTGTPLGDPIEAQSLGDLFARHSEGDPPCYLGSVKANIGHGETSAGIAGLIKVVMMLRNRRIPKQTHLEELNSRIALEKSRLLIAREPLDWDAQLSRIAGVSAFGFGGTNAHVIIEEASSHERDKPDLTRPLHLLPLATPTTDGMQRLAEKYGDWIDEHPDASLADVCFTAGAGRAHFVHRAAIIADSIEQLRDRVSELSSGALSSSVRRGSTSLARPTNVAFLFSGQGSQYLSMGSQLYATQPVFRQSLDECDAILQEHLEESIIATIAENESDSPKLFQTQYTQPALFSIEYALANLWMSWGVKPTIALGHSIGEYAAACVAGVFSLADGLRLISHRGRLMQKLPQNGLMAVVFDSYDRVTGLLDGWHEEVTIAAHNGPQNCVISGLAESVRKIMMRCEEAGVKTQLLNVSHAFHSPLMDPMLDEFYDVAKTIEYHAPQIPFVSCLTGKPLTEPPTASYWRDHVRNTVQFATAIETLDESVPDVLIEQGPSTTLLGMGRRCLPESVGAWLPSLRPSSNSWQVILESLAECYVRGVAVDWRGFDQPWSRQRVEIPTYPFERIRHWVREGKRRSRSTTQRGGLHPLLGWPLSTPLPNTLFEASLSAKTPSFLVDHQVQGSVVFPATAYVEQALAAAEQVFESKTAVIENLAIQQPMLLDEERNVQISMAPEANGLRVFEIYSSRCESGPEEPNWLMHACGMLKQGKPNNDAGPLNIDSVRDRLTEETEPADFYQSMTDRALAYGPTFQVLGSLFQGSQQGIQESLASVDLPRQVAEEMKRYHVHPALLDGCLQAAAGIVPREPDGTHSPFTYLPTAIKRISLFRRPADEEMWIYAVSSSSSDQPNPDFVEGDVLLTDGQGKLIVKLEGIRLQRTGRSADSQTEYGPGDWLYQLDWDLKETNEPGSPSAMQKEVSHWLVFADAAGIGNELIKQLEQCGAQCVRVRPGKEFRQLCGDKTSDDRVYEIDPLAESDYAQLLADWLPHEPTGCGILHLWSRDLGDPGDRGAGIVEANRLGVGSVLALVKQSTRFAAGSQFDITVATFGAQSVAGHAPKAITQSPTWGLGRVTTNEYPDISFRMMDLDPNDNVTRAAETLATELLAPVQESQVAIRDGKRYVPRLQHAPNVAESSSQSSLSRTPPGGPFRLRLGGTGTFENLGFESFQRQRPGRNQVEIETNYAGLNFSDVMKAMGLYPGVTDDIVPLGIECSGTVTAIGDEVTDFQVGDNVMGVAPYSLASHAIAADYCLVHRPDHISDADACTIPITFLTAYYGLCQLADLQPGEKVLIHAAAGGVGQAAIQIAQHVGAEIFATAGSEEKREFLRSLGVSHVFNTRTLEFADQILEVTDRRGVDVVLNSLPGEAITKSLSILSAYGRFLEIGKIDIYQNRMIGLLPFQDNLSYHAIDLDRMFRQRPVLVRDLFRRVMEHFVQGNYKPLPLNQFAAEDVVDAFRFMAQRRNIGKVVVSTQGTGDACIETADQLVRDDGSYLVTGGIGALGRWTSKWLAEQGAKHLVLLSRRPAGPEATDSIESLQQAGVRVAVVNGDVAEFDSLQAALKQIPKDFPVLRGVIHAAGVLEDGLMREMDFMQMDRVMKPKVQGAWNLHQVTEDDPLDFFVMYSSVSSLLGTPGQANYAAANAFLDALAEFRTAAGLPGTSVRWGPWADAGMAARSAKQSNPVRGLQSMTADNALSVLGAVIRSGEPDTIVMDVDWAEFLQRVPRQLLRVLEGAADGLAESDRESDLDLEFIQNVRSAQPAERQALMQQRISKNISSIMSVKEDQIQVDQPLSLLGLDSLMAMELNVQLEKTLGISLPMSALAENPNVVSLAQQAVIVLTASGLENVDSNSTSIDSSVPDETTEPMLIALSAQSDKPPLFCIHPVGGDIRCYFELAKQIESHSVFAIRASGLNPSETPHRSIEEMAKDYLQAIRQVQPSGAYYLVGWSTGGIFAYEVARQMRMQELDVGALIFIDTPMPSIFSDVDLNDEARFLHDMVNFSNWFAGTQMQISYEELKRKDSAESLKIVLQEAIRHRVLRADSTVARLQRLIEVCQANVQGILNYEPPSFEQPVLLLSPADTTALAEASGHSLPQDLGWRQVIGEQLSIRTVPGDHFSMMTGDNAAKLTELLTEWLADCIAKSLSAKLDS